MHQEQPRAETAHDSFGPIGRCPLALFQLLVMGPDSDSDPGYDPSYNAATGE
jgi:hypothetical protein